LAKARGKSTFPAVRTVSLGRRDACPTLAKPPANLLSPARAPFAAWRDAGGSRSTTRVGWPPNITQGWKISVHEVTFSCEQMNDLGKLIFICGLVIAGIGLVLWSGFGKGWLGRLPGDIHYYGKGNFSFHFPIVTCLLISVLLTILLWLFRK
jgi:hypothetical protein